MATKTVATNDEPNDEPIPLAVIEAVYDEARKHGKDVPDDPETAYADKQSENDDGHSDAGAIPVFMDDETDTADAVTSGLCTPFNYSETADKVVGRGRDTGKEHVTTAYVRVVLDRVGGDLLQAVRLVTRHLIETGQFDLASMKFDVFTADGVSNDEVTAYAIATYAKGWLAEAILSGEERFTKASQSNDEAGQDLYDKVLGDYVQVKSVTYDKQKDAHIYYQWTCRGSLVYGEDLEEVNHKAAEESGRVGDARRKGVDIGTTQIKKNRKGRRRRLLWW